MNVSTVKRMFLFLAAGFLLQAAAENPTTEQITIDQLVDQAVKEAIGKAQSSLAASPVKSNAAIAVLPFYGDQNAIVRDRMRNAITASGRTCVEEQGNPILGEILKEIAWDERKEDVLDPATVAKFGRLQGVQCLLYGGVLNRIATDRFVFVELEFHLTEIATRKHIWGGSFASRKYANPNGIISLSSEIRNAMRGKFRAALADSLKKSPRLASVKKAACLPVVADIDGYVAGLVRDVLSSSSVTPVGLDVATRAEARLVLKEGRDMGDAILYGVLRDCSAEFKGNDYLRLAKKYTGQMEIQLCIEKAVTHEILWSDTLYAKEDYTRPMPLKELKNVVTWPLGILAALIVLLVIIRKATRVR